LTGKRYTERVKLRKLKNSDATEFLSNSSQSKALHKSWVIVPRTKKQFKAYVQEMDTDSNKAFAVIHQASQAMVGVVELRDIFHFDFKNSYITYYAFEHYARQGLMTSAVLNVITIAFKKLKLHRLEANIQPDNQASIALAKACGFKKEGFSPKFIKKGGKWKDHERWALLND